MFKFKFYDFCWNDKDERGTGLDLRFIDIEVYWNCMDN